MIRVGLSRMSFERRTELSAFTLTELSICKGNDLTAARRCVGEVFMSRKTDTKRLVSDAKIRTRRTSSTE